MNTVGTPLLWGGFAVVVAIMLAIDLLLQGRRGAHGMTMKQAAAWSLVWVTLSLLFNAAFWWYLVQTEGRAVADPQALAFLTGYLIEKSLAVDNVFVWLMLFSYFSVPAALQRRVLVYGVLGAIVLRTIMIFTGSWLISQFDWILYIFGAFLLFTGVKMALAHEDESGIGDKPLVRWLRGHLRMTDTIDNEHFFVRKNGLLYATPLMLVRPVSGSGALAVGSDLIATYVPDSYIGRVAAVMLGSTETTFYTIAVYFGSAGIIRTRHTVPAALAADLTGFLASAFAVRLFFGA